MNYIGGKFKLLPQILPLFPDKISMFYDVFGGGGNMSLNVKSEFVYYNDIVGYVSDVFESVKGEKTDECIDRIAEIVDRFKLSKTNKEGFESLREYYNEGNTSWEVFYTLMCYSFNNQYRFNNNLKYNSSFGKHKSCFSKHTETKFRNFMNRINPIDVTFDVKDFRDIDFSDADHNDLVYFDPPYLISTGNYNDGKRGFNGWGIKDEKDLLKLCDELDDKGTRFALSNVFKHKGMTNDILIDWSKKYKVNFLNYDYNNSNYQSKAKEGKTVEVLITNYQ